MSHASDPRFAVLHALRLKGFADVDAISEQTGLYPSQVHNFLEHLQVAEHVFHREGGVTGWALTPSGRRRHAELIGAELDGSASREAVDSVYQRFLPLNQELLAVCSEWQVRPSEAADGKDQDPVLNDHKDFAYDARIVRRLHKIDNEVQPLCRELARTLGRFATYGPRLTRALDRVDKGDHDWFTKPMIDSYHTVWFELHEDLLTTLGLERSRVGR